MTRSNDEITKALMVPFPRSAIKYREEHGTRLPYVEAHTVIRRLIDATANTFDVAVLEQSVQPNGKTSKGADKFQITARVRLTIPGLGSREHMGVQGVVAGGGEDLAKGAISDAIKKAATLFGVALDLYGPDYEAGEVDDRAPVQRPAPRQDAPSAQMASERQRQMVRERWGALRLNPDLLDSQTRKLYGVRLQDLGRDDAADLIAKLDAKITAASPRGLTPQPAEPSPAELTDMADDERMDDDDYAQVVASIDAEHAPDRAALAAHYTS